MLVNVLPGLRELRAPLVSGYLWLVAFFLLFHSDLPTRQSAGSAISPVFDIADRLSVLGLATVASVAAYMVGSAMQEILKLIGRKVRPGRPLYGEPGAHTSADGTTRLLRSVGLRIQRIAQSLAQVALSPGERGIGGWPSDEEVVLDLPVVRILLLGEHPELVGELDRLQAEADLRITVSIPIGFLAAYFAVVSSPGWLFVLIPAFLLLIQGFQRQREVGDFLVRVLQIGKTDHPAAKTFELSVKAAIEHTELEWSLQAEMEGGDGRAAYRYGNLLMSAREFERAIEPLEIAARSGVSEAYAQLGVAHERLNEDGRAERAYRDGAERGEGKAKQFLADFLVRHDRDEEARESIKEPDEPAPRRPSSSPSRDRQKQIAEYREKVAEGQGKAALNLGLLFKTGGEKESAIDAFKKATEMDPEDAEGWLQLGAVLEEARQPVEAKDALKRALRIREVERGPNHLSIAPILGNLGNVLSMLGESEEARQLQERALDIQRRELGDQSIEAGRTLGNLGNVVRGLGEVEEAAKLEEEALAIKERHLGADHPSIAITLANLGVCLAEMNELERAKEVQERALAIEEHVYGADHIEVARTCSFLGSTLRRMERYEEALALYERGLKIEEQELGPDNVDVARALGNIGETLLVLDKPDLAEQALVRAVGIAIADRETMPESEIQELRDGLAEAQEAEADDEADQGEEPPH